MARSSGNPWAELVCALDEGRSLAEACASSRLDRRAADRLTATGAAAWVELLDGLEGARVLVADHSPGLVGMRVAAEAAVVGFAETDEGRAQFRRSWLGREPARLVIGAEERLAAEEGPWDVVIVDGLRTGWTGQETSSLEVRLRRLSAGLARHGRLVVVADNRLSGLRAADMTVGRPAGPGGPSSRAVERAMKRSGLAMVQRFGLLRSSVDGVTAFDLDAPRASAAILSAATVRTGPIRTAGLRLLAMLAQRGVAGSLLPARMVVARQAAAPWSPDDRRPTGRLGYRSSHESKVLRGEPPVELDKRCPTPEGAAREAMALRVLESFGLTLAPRLLGQPSATRISQTWQAGTPMRPMGIPRDQLQMWVARAAETLGTMQRATERSDGSVLVHGDYWLGNLLVDGEEIVGVLDWTRAHWGEPTEDLHHLVKHLVRMGLARAGEEGVLIELAQTARGTR